jgi:hypothetical protein
MGSLRNFPLLIFERKVSDTLQPIVHFLFQTADRHAGMKIFVLKGQAFIDHFQVLLSSNGKRIVDCLGMPKLREPVSEVDRAMPGVPEVEFSG